MRLWPRQWHPETWVCSIRGHIAPGRYVARLDPPGAGGEIIAVALPNGRRLAKCLRCDAWVEHDAPTGEGVRYELIPPRSEWPEPRRGDVLADAIVLRLIALNKAVHAAAFTVLAVTLLLVRSHLSSVTSWSSRLLELVQERLDETGQGSSHSWTARQLEHLGNLHAHSLAVLISLAAVYAVVEWVEAAGLWTEQRWAEYLTVLATSGFLPLEIHELTVKVTVLRVLALVVNVALVVWMIRKKRLFRWLVPRRAAPS